MNLEKALQTATDANSITDKKSASELISVLMSALEDPSIDQDIVQQIFNVVIDNNTLFKRDSDKMLDLIILLAQRVDETSLAEIYRKYALGSKTKKYIVENREIWQRIEQFEHDIDAHRLYNNSTSKQRWDIIRKIVIGTEHSIGTKKSSVILHHSHWLEAKASSAGKHFRADENEDWLKVWKKSKVNVSFQDWLSAVMTQESDVAYYDPNERDKFEIIIKDGKCLDTKGVLVDTTADEGQDKEISEMGFVSCVLSTQEKFYCYSSKYGLENKKLGDHKHSGYISGEPVVFPGEIYVEQGLIKKISLRSGHYRPTEKSLYEFLKYLKKKGIDLDGIELYGWSRKPLAKNANEWFKNFTHKQIEPICSIQKTPNVNNKTQQRPARGLPPPRIPPHIT